MNKNCQQCNKEFEKPKDYSDKQWNGRKFCSIVCSAGDKKVSYLGTKHTAKQRKKIGDANRGEKNGYWKGDAVGYSGLHRWVPKVLGKPDTCEACKKSELSGRQIHWANKSQKYQRVVSDWLRLCASCHKRYDNGSLLLNLTK